MLNKEKEVVGFYISGHPLDDYKLELDYFCTHRMSDFNEFEKLKGKDILVGGMVSQIDHRFTKNGNPFGTMTIEDYSDQFTFYLFGDDYPKFKPYMSEGWFLYAQCRVQERKWDKEGNLELKLVKLELLSEVKEKSIRSLHLTIDVDDVSSELLNEISTSEQHQGRHNLKFLVSDRKEGYSVQLRAKACKIELDEVLINRLKQMPFLEVQIN